MFFKKKQNLESFLADHHLIKKPKSKKRLILTIVGVIFAVFLIISLPLLINGYAIYRQAKKLDSHIGLIVSGVSAGNIADANSNLLLVKDDLMAIKSRAKKLGLILYIPGIANTSSALDRMLSASINLTDGYSDLLGVFSTLSPASNEGGLVAMLSTKDGRAAMLSLIKNNQTAIASAQAKIAKAKTDMSEISQSDLSGIFKEKVAQANSILSLVAGQSDAIMPLVNYLPDIAGLYGEKNYLVLFENNMELRPTGGFIGSYGLITVQNGEIKNITTDDIYNLDKLSKDKMFVAAPWPMTAYNKQKYLFLRDANWSPDWPTSARLINTLWETERANAGLAPVKLDGIIAITPDFIANFLDVTGPITADGITFTKKNFAMDLEQAVEFDYAQKGIPLSERKSIIGDLAGELISKIMKLGVKDILKLWNVAKEDIEGKQMIVWLADSKLQEFVAAENWAGEIVSADNDYLYVVDANLAALKTDSVMQRDVSYSIVANESGDLVGRVAIKYKHTAKAVSALISAYRSYTRIYVPDGTWFTKAYLEDSRGLQNLALGTDVNISSEFNKKVAGVFFTVDPLSEKTLVMEYKLPDAVKKQIAGGSYSLYIQKQPGTTGHGLNVDLKFDKLITVWQSDAAPKQASGRNLVWSQALDTDKEYKVKF